MENHTWELHHGDCLEVMRGIPSESVDAVITDPPYGIDYQSAWRTDKKNWKPKIANDRKPFIWWLYDAFRITKDGGCLLCFCRWDVQEVFRLAIECAGFQVKSQIIWDREVHGMGDLKGEFAPQHDVIWFAVKGRFNFSGKRPSTVVHSQRISGDKLVHPNEKPLDLMKQLICGVTAPDAKVLDCFVGSGSTGVSCALVGRKFVGIERDEAYYNIARNRLTTTQQSVAPDRLQPSLWATPDATASQAF